MAAISAWAGPLMGRTAEGDTFRSHWIAQPVAALFPGVDPARPELTVEVRCGDEPMTVRSAGGELRVDRGQAAAPDLVLTGPPDATVELLAQRIDAAEAAARGLAVTGDAGLLRGLRPARRAAAPGPGAASPAA